MTRQLWLNQLKLKEIVLKNDLYVDIVLFVLTISVQLKGFNETGFKLRNQRYPYDHSTNCTTACVLIYYEPKTVAIVQLFLIWCKRKGFNKTGFYKTGFKLRNQDTHTLTVPTAPQPGSSFITSLKMLPLFSYF